MPKIINPRIFRLPGFVVTSSVLLLAISGCASDKEVGLCSYLGGCMENEDDEDASGISAPAATPSRRSDPGVMQDTSGGDQ